MTSNLVELNRKRRRPLRVRFWSKVESSTGCWLWKGSLNNKGYGTICVDPIRKRPGFAHRVSWMLHVGPVPDGLRVLHRCDTPACVRPDHLFLGTQLDNVRDMDSKGRRVNASQKLTPEQLAEIPELVARGETQREIGARFGVSGSTISRVGRSTR